MRAFIAFQSMNDAPDDDPLCKGGKRRRPAPERDTVMKKYPVAVLALVIWLSVSGIAPAAEPSAMSSEGSAVAEDVSATRPLFPAELFARTELFFGSLRSDKPPVSEQDFLGFLNDIITPLFPNGLTLLTGLGQFLSSQGVIQQEQSWLLILLYPVGERWDSNGKIEEIRDEYKKAFEQESVLRSDRCCELVGF